MNYANLPALPGFVNGFEFRMQTAKIISQLEKLAMNGADPGPLMRTAPKQDATPPRARLNAVRIRPYRRPPMARLSLRDKAITAAAALPLAAGLISHFEGNRTEAYLDPVGIPTVCAGHTAGVQLGQVYTQTECDAMTRADVEDAMANVLALSTVPLSALELVAYTSLVYNIGPGAFRRSTLLTIMAVAAAPVDERDLNVEGGR